MCSQRYVDLLRFSYVIRKECMILQKCLLLFKVHGHSSSKEAQEWVLVILFELQTYKPACTHLICGRLSRSEKFLCACAQGRWVLHPNYINDSAKEGIWLPEENYEWVNFSDSETQEMGETARRWRFHVEAFMTLPFSGWKVAVIVRGSRKSSIYTRSLL